MLYFALAKFVQVRAPLPILFQILGDTLGEKNVAGIAAIHHTLCDVDARAGDVRAIVYVHDPADGSAMNAHPHPQF